ncbi:MAG: flagellar basal body L-ring protein FlgH [Candidatus Margulisiibacteriota bacterium]|nr:flagellar basal body L-ring protein FlgH [Candidatus Margulisiibacteriota bacterium]
MLISSCSFADSVWNEKSSSPYTTDKSYSVGDIITVIVEENTSAKSSANTKTDIKDDFGAKLSHTIAALNPLIGGDNSASANWSNKYTGSGKTERLSDISAKIATSVIEVLENGNIVIEGKHKVMVNDEEQIISIKGMVRSKDISIANTVDSSQVADADVSIVGYGAVQEAESPGWITRFLNWIF